MRSRRDRRLAPRPSGSRSRRRPRREGVGEDSSGVGADRGSDHAHRGDSAAPAAGGHAEPGGATQPQGHDRGRLGSRGEPGQRGRTFPSRRSRSLWMTRVFSLLTVFAATPHCAAIAAGVSPASVACHLHAVGGTGVVRSGPRVDRTCRPSRASSSRQRRGRRARDPVTFAATVPHVRRSEESMSSPK